MTRLGWISAVLFLVQAAIAGSAINEFSSMAQMFRGQAEYACDDRWGARSQTPNQNERLNCMTGYWRLEDAEKTNVRYAWIALAFGSALTLFGVYRGYRNAR